MAMPANPRSLQITDAYRERLNALADRLAALTQAQWQRVTLANLDGTHADWLASTVAMLEAAQRAGVHVTAAYLAAFIGSETGRTANELPRVDDARFVGLADDGQALGVPLGKTLIGVKAALKAGKAPGGGARGRRRPRGAARVDGGPRGPQGRARGPDRDAPDARRVAQGHARRLRRVPRVRRARL
jgi:hypothetical protein